MKAFTGIDICLLDEELTEEERLVRDTVRDFVSRDIMPLIEDCNRQGRFPKEIVKPMAELGLLGANLEGYGCSGMGPIAYGLAMQELERGDSGIRSFASVQGALCMYPIHAFGTETQKEKYLPGMAKGELIGCFGLTEPDFGSNPSGMLTRAEKKGDKWILNGTKFWITNGGICDVAIVWARTEAGIQGFLVDRDLPGFTTKDIKGKFSLRASVTSELNFENVELGPEHVLEKAKGLKAALACLNQARFGISWGVIGSAMAVFDEALEYSKNRVQFDRPIAGFQLVQDKLVWMATEITKAQLLALRIGRLKEKGKIEYQHVSIAKMNNTWVARECAKLARDILGANGVHDEYQVGRHMCNIESVYTYEGTHDIHKLVLGEFLTGHSAFR